MLPYVQMNSKATTDNLGPDVRFYVAQEHCPYNRMEFCLAPSAFSGVCFAQALGLYVVFCRSLFFLWSLYCMVWPSTNSKATTENLGSDFGFMQHKTIVHRIKWNSAQHPRPLVGYVLLRLQFCMQCFVDHCVSFGRFSCGRCIVLSGLLRFTDSDYPNGIFKPLLQSAHRQRCRYMSVVTETYRI